MTLNLNSDNSNQKIYPRSRLLLCRAVVVLLLVFAATIYFMCLVSDRQSPWSIFFWPIVAALLLAFAVVENLLCGLPAQVETCSQGNTGGKERKKYFWTLPASAPVKRWMTLGYQLTVTTASSLLAIYFAANNFSTEVVLTPVERGLFTIVSLLLVICFGLLVSERMLSHRSMRNWPLQTACVGLSRTLLSVVLLITIALVMSSFALQSAYWVTCLASSIVLWVAVEFLICAFVTACTVPASTAKTPLFLTKSLLAELYHWPFHPLLLLRKKIHRHFGIDIGKIQAFRLMGHLFFPVLSCIVLVGWVSSSLNEVSLHQRGVYERFGRPVEVLQPGLHLGLPWPFGRVVAVDYGEVHELQLSEPRPVKDASAAKIVDSIEGPAPQESWRLWDNSHSTDQAQMIASAMSGKQSFQIVNMDIRLIWRVGMKDNDAVKSIYKTDDLSATIQRIARQVLTQYFAHQQLDALLNEQRATMAKTLNQEIQRRLSKLDIGVELLYTRVESIHPPAGAANAYHGVQAAQITANTQIARERGYAATSSNDAQRKAATTINLALATAHELQSQSKKSLTRYSAEHDAWKINPEAYLQERRYQTYSKALSTTSLLILDNQLTGHNEPVLDLRQFSR
ncbi:protease modulator HflK [Dryocola clanedunensis]|uniref:protease modulator HflK n=1 Tax=Cedecea sulfonylureivorans TaxID=3051154 RepID=UPI001928181E|nr:protease modulator HflK [Cedecea sulfonylureivorans]